MSIFGRGFIPPSPLVHHCPPPIVFVDAECRTPRRRPRVYRRNIRNDFVSPGPFILVVVYPGHPPVSRVPPFGIRPRRPSTKTRACTRFLGRFNRISRKRNAHRDDDEHPADVALPIVTTTKRIRYTDYTDGVRARRKRNLPDTTRKRTAYVVPSRARTESIFVIGVRAYGSVVTPVRCASITYRPPHPSVSVTAQIRDRTR